MAKLNPNDILGLLQGSLGGLIFSRTKDGQVHVRRSPVRKVGFREPELYTPYQQSAKLKGSG